MKKIYVVLIASLLMPFMTVKAQDVSPVDFMKMNPYQMNSNPAVDLPYQSVMSLFVGNFNLSVLTTTLRYDNLFDFNAQGKPEAFAVRKFANSLKKSNYLGINMNENMFALDRRLKKGMLTFGYNYRVQGGVGFNDGLFGLMAYGNAAYLGESNPVDVNLSVNVQAFQELGVGYQINLTDQLSIGGRTKLLFGFANVKTNAAEAQIFTDAQSYALRLRENVDMRATLPRVVVINDKGMLQTQGRFNPADLFSNPGFGVDLAAEYRFDEHFSAVAAVNDLGFIHWRSNCMQLTSNVNDVGQFYDDGSFLFEGLDYDQILQLSSDVTYREHFLDTLTQYFNLEFSPLKNYNTMLYTNMLLRGNYDIDSQKRVTVQASGQFVGKGFHPAMTFAYSQSFLDMFDVCATYTMMNHSYDNFGLGVAGNFGTFHIYFASNNVLGFFSPLNTSAMNFQMGIVFNLRMEEKRFIDESGMPEYLE